MEQEYERQYVRRDGTLTIIGLRTIVALNGIKPMSTEEKLLIMRGDEYAEEFSKKIGSITRSNKNE